MFSFRFAFVFRQEHAVKALNLDEGWRAQRRQTS